MVHHVETAFQKWHVEVYALARARLRRDRAPISTGTLAHELYINLRTRAAASFESRGEFLAYVSRAIRSILVDMARARIAQKRAAELLPLTLGAEVHDYAGTPEELVQLDQALVLLEQLDSTAAMVADLRIIGGLEVPIIAAELGIGETTVKRHWKKAKQFLKKVLRDGMDARHEPA